MVRPIERGIDMPCVGDRFPIGDVTIVITCVEPQSSNDREMRTIVTGRDGNGENVELRFIPDKEWEDDA